jgi:glycosyltransferase involved in cell wall biosynthesis
MSNLGVSCLCLTYGRPHLLEEAIESFLRQDWDGPKELIVLNDHPEQTLVFSHPQVSVFNIPRRLRTLGEKRNLSVSLAKYDNLLIWDDDDIYLPWRIQETMKTLPQAQFFKCPNAWTMNDGRIESNLGYNLYHGGTAYTRWLWEQVGGYKAMNGGEDADIEGRFQQVGNNKQYWPHTQLTKDKIYYIYRWQHGSYHTTGHSSLENIKPRVESGVINLKPKWNLPYQKLAYEASGVNSALPKSSSAINFIAFSKNRPLQLDGYLRSFNYAFDGNNVELSVIYTCDVEYENAYSQVISLYPNVKFIKETNFNENLISAFNDSEFTCFGCDDVIYRRKIDYQKVLETMRSERSFAFSFRLGKGVKRSMFSGPMVQPAFADDGHVLSWDLHKSHANGDFGYAWELDGTVYPTKIARLIVEELKAPSPNILEANGGGRWSSKTKKSIMSCFYEAALVVPTVNVVQVNFHNSTVGKPISTKFLLDAWNNGMRLDIDRYQNVEFDCVHVSDFYLTNR